MPLRFNKYARIYKFKNSDDQWSEQYQDIDEYIARRCESEKINWKALEMKDRLKLAEKYGCKKDFVNSIYHQKDKF